MSIISTSDWTIGSQLATPNSTAPPSGVGQEIFHNYIDLIRSKTNVSAEEKQQEPLDRPFDFFDDEEFAFGINLLNNNVSCVGENMTKLIQMAQEPWPDNVKLFQPYEVEQILLPDNASCLAVQAFLKMCNLPFEVEMRWNAEFMSPSGRVPFIKCGAFVVSELEPIVQFAANKGVTLCSKLTTEEKAEMRAYMSLITNVLVNAELYISWIDNETYNAVTKVRNSSVYPWPLGWLQTRAKRGAVAKRLKALHWHDKTMDQVLSDVEQCCNSLSQRLGDRDYFFGNTPTALDALVFGHMRALLSADGPKAALMIKPITTSLLKHTMKMVCATGMTLKPQEEYLISQAFQVTRLRMSPERTVSERSTRVRRSRLCLRNSRDDINYNKDTFGFKPFASKQITIMASKEGGLICTYDPPKQSLVSINISNQNFVVEVIEDILDKVDEIAFEMSHDKYENDTHDFEIVYPNDGDSKVGNVMYKINEFLDTIEENTDSADPSTYVKEFHVVSYDDALIHGDGGNVNFDGETRDSGDRDDETNDLDDRDDETNDLDDRDGETHVSDGFNLKDLVEDSDGVVNDKLLSSQMESSDSVENICLSDVTDSSNNNAMKRTSLTDTSNGAIASRCSEKSGPRTPLSSGSFSTLKMPSDEEISVESLLKYLRERNAAYGNIEIADVD